MKNLVILICFAFITLFLASCGNKADDIVINGKIIKASENDYQGEKLDITNKIMYDVPIRNELIGDRSKNNPDWFWENLPSPQDSEFLQDLLNDAIIGKLKTYYFDISGDYSSFEEIPETELKNYMEKCFNYEFEVIDTTVLPNKTDIMKVQLDHSNIVKIRFLEEWYIAEGVFKKRVIAIAPYFSYLRPDNELINFVFFWILVDGQ
ncbi:MAG: hypothetical protein GX793_03235 [Bacteroidales bacterium]|jgi:hypothetical protein|nr:hypothetical protein [Bacteroidales bacterium]MCK9497912.1 hypothetical protein [Bacteroidales bacterium]MDY0313912.1 hypothetical protein [Bacteroidales bacterium]NLB86058.1 hypothetical protein [Bacteroidales bacterium]